MKTKILFGIVISLIFIASVFADSDLNQTQLIQQYLNATGVSDITNLTPEQMEELRQLLGLPKITGNFENDKDNWVSFLLNFDLLQTTSDFFLSFLDISPWLMKSLLVLISCVSLYALTIKAKNIFGYLLLFSGIVIAILVVLQVMGFIPVI